MTIEQNIQHYLLKSPYSLPYIYSIVACLFGFSVFQYTHEFKDIAGITVNWLGVSMMFFGTISLFLWHFLKWPPYFAGGRNEVHSINSKQHSSSQNSEDQEQGQAEKEYAR